MMILVSFTLLLLQCCNCTTKTPIAPATMTQDSTNSDNVHVPVPAKEKDGQPTIASVATAWLAKPRLRRPWLLP